MSTTKRVGVLLAAGRSERMARPKQLLPWPPQASRSKPLVAAAFDAVARVCDAMVVVAGHYGDEVVEALGQRPFHRTAGDFGTELFASVRRGLLAAEQLDASAAILLHPADHPLVRRDTLERLILAGTEVPDCACMPTYRGRGGHPVLIPAALVLEILSYGGAGGLRQFWAEHPERCLRIATDDAGVVFDIDTPLDYDLSIQ